MTLLRKLGLGLGTLLVLLLCLGILAVQRLDALKQSLDIVTLKVVPKKSMANSSIQDVYDNARDLASLLVLQAQGRPDLQRIAGIDAAMAARSQTMDKRLVTLKESLGTVEEAALMATIETSRARYVASRKRAIQVGRTGNSEQALAIIYGETDALQTQYITAWKALIECEERARFAAEEVSASALSNAALELPLGLMLLAAGWLGLVLWIAATVRAELGESPESLRAAVARVAAGNLRETRIGEGPHQSGLLAALAAMTQQLSATLAHVRESAKVVQGAAVQISQGHAALSLRTDSQACWVEQSAEALEQFSGAVVSNTTSAEAAATLAVNACQVAARGVAQVARLADMMRQLRSAATRITAMTGMIDAIAFQTNILALSAAVEAGRAGERGRGFAMVAHDIRSLAGRAALAAEQIKRLMADADLQIAAGQALAEQARLTMDLTRDHIRQVSQHVVGINQAGREQAQEIAQLRENLVELERVTQHNAALVEKAGAVALALQHQSAELDRAAAAFATDTH